MAKKMGLDQFIDRMKTDSELVKRLEAADQAYTGDRTDLVSLVSANILPIASQEGYSFTAEEYAEHVKAAMQKKEANKILADEELDAVAGGFDDVNITGDGAPVTVIDNSRNNHYYIVINL